MNDDKSVKEAPPEEKRISLKNAWEIEYWTKELKVPLETIKKAMAKVGDFASEVKAHLKIRK